MMMIHDDIMTWWHDDDTLKVQLVGV